MSHPFVERQIGSVRRELLDQTFFLTATDLENKLRDYQDYYNEHRCHSSRDGDTPVCSEGENIVSLNNYGWKQHCHIPGYPVNLNRQCTQLKCNEPAVIVARS